MTLNPIDAGEILQANILEAGSHPGWMHHPRVLSS